VVVAWIKNAYIFVRNILKKMTSHEERIEIIKEIVKAIPIKGILLYKLVEEIMRVYQFTRLTAKEYCDSIIISGRVKIMNGRVYPIKNQSVK
jgi:hypothetical protein